MSGAALPPERFEAWLRDEGARRYHATHPFHLRMHAGALTPEQLRRWVLNRYYYQTRIPVKDALILSKSEDPRFRRWWIQRLHDHDDEDGGLALWLRMAGAVGCDVEEVASCRAVLPGVRFACDAYVTLVRDATLVEAVASSLTECFAPDLMAERVAAWERHYPWVPRDALTYFRARVPRARTDGAQALTFVLREARTYDVQARCVQALVRKTEILWSLLDAVEQAGGTVPP
jgi:pyrroloquinoline-quinone synthase